MLGGDTVLCAARDDGYDAVRGSAWDGDPRRVWLMAWRDEESQLAVVMVAVGGDVVGWANLAHVNQDERPLARLWVCHAAEHRPPFDYLLADDVAGLRAALIAT